MKFWRSWRVRRRAQRRKHAAEKNNAPLREFVYLDEVSVYSLLASRLGAIATEFTDVETRTFSAEMSGTVKADAAVLKSTVGSKLATSQARGSQVLRKSIVQTTFKELYDMEQGRFAAKPAEGLTPIRAKLPLDPSTLNEYDSPWVIPGHAFSRGDLVEFEVALGAEPIFTNSAVVSTLMHLLEKNPPLAQAVSAGELRQMEAVAQILEQLLAGLVPIRARAVDYSVIRMDGRDLVVHEELCRLLPHAARARLRPLHLVGVADESLFWKDIRRLLFADSKFRILSRVSRPAIQDSWTPVKLAHVLESVMPSVGQHLDVFNRPVAGATPLENPPANSAIELALQNFAVAACRAVGRELPGDFACEDIAAACEEGQMETVEGRRHIFGAVTERLEAWDVRVDRETAARLRTESLATAGFDLDGSYSRSRTDGPSSSPANLANQGDSAFLDVEFVAIYW